MARFFWGALAAEATAQILAFALEGEQGRKSGKFSGSTTRGQSSAAMSMRSEPNGEVVISCPICAVVNIVSGIR